MSDCTNNLISKMSSCIPSALHPRSAREYMQRMRHNFGSKFMIELLSVYMGVKGAMNQFMGLSMLPLYRQMGLDGLKYQAASTVAMSPWAMKGILGVLSDGFPIMGLHKRPYMLFAGVMGAIAIFTLALTPVDVASAIPMIVPLFFFFANLQASTMDLLCEGMYSRYMVEKPESKSDVVSFVWVSIMTGSLIASCIVGPVADYIGASAIYWFCLPFSVQSLIPTALGCLPEERVREGLCPPKVITDIDGEELSEHAAAEWEELQAREKELAIKAGRKGAFTMAISMAIGAMGQAAFASFGTYTMTLIYCLFAATTLSVMCFYCLNKTLAKCNLYMFLGDALYLSISGALDFWYTAKEDCVPNGPAFGYTYYNTYTQVVGTLASLVGIWLFQTTMSGWKLRTVFWMSTLLKVVASFVDFVIVKRWNRDYLGIDDHWAYMLGDAIIARVCEMLNFMPAVVLTSKLCPKYIEATVFAVLAGFSNFGQAVAKSAGVVAIQVIGVSTTAPSCNFDNLPTLIAVAHGAIPMIAIPLTFLLIPDKRLSDNIAEDSDDEDMSSGSCDSCDIMQHPDKLSGIRGDVSSAYDDVLGGLDDNSELGSLVGRRLKSAATTYGGASSKKPSYVQIAPETESKTFNIGPIVVTSPDKSHPHAHEHGLEPPFMSPTSSSVIPPSSGHRHHQGRPRHSRHGSTSSMISDSGTMIGAVVGGVVSGAMRGSGGPPSSSVVYPKAHKHHKDASKFDHSEWEGESKKKGLDEIDFFGEDTEQADSSARNTNLNSSIRIPAEEGDIKLHSPDQGVSSKNNNVEPQLLGKSEDDLESAKDVKDLSFSHDGESEENGKEKPDDNLDLLSS